MQDLGEGAIEAGERPCPRRTAGAPCPAVSAGASTRRLDRSRATEDRRKCPPNQCLPNQSPPIAAAVPALSVHWSSASDSRVVPTSQSARVGADSVAQRFPGAGSTQPLTVAIAAPRSSAAAVAAVARSVGELPGIKGALTPSYLGAGTWTIEAQLSGDQTGVRAQRDVRLIREIDVPFPIHVTGQAAEFVDQQGAIASDLPLVLGLLALLTFALLWLMTDSLLLPIKAIVMNLLTVGAALTSVVVIFQHGNLSGVLGYTPDGGVETSSFVVAAALVFALSTDYGVFLLGGLRSSGTRAGDRQAVAAGLGATGRVVTAAAILLAVAIGAFTTSQISFIQQLGVTVVIGVLIDAFVVRSLLVPSLMALLGRCATTAAAFRSSSKRRCGWRARSRATSGCPGFRRRSGVSTCRPARP